MRCIIVGFILVTLMVGATARAQDNYRAEGAALYRENCGVCHGEIAAEASHRFDVPAWRHFVRAGLPSGPGLSDVGKGLAYATITSLASERIDMQRTADDEPVAVAPPFGPPLHGVVGRLAGSVEGFPYSRAFKSTLREMVWDREALDRWITDSQAWVPGSMMFYKQTDPEIRRKIITYLEATP